MTSSLTMARRTLLAGLGMTLGASAASSGLKAARPVVASGAPLAARLQGRGQAVHVDGIDMHSHVPILSPGETFDLAGGMRRNGLSAICATYPVDAVRSPGPGQWYGDYVRWLDGLDAMVQAGALRKVLRASDLAAAASKGEPVVIVSCEGAQFLEGKLERIAEFHARGLRHLQLVHSVHGAIAPLADLQTSDPRFDGLTGFGREVIQECNRLGIVIDMAHASPKAVQDAMALSRSPIIFSHGSLLTPTGLGAIAENRDPRLPMRLLRKDDARAIAQAGGIVGVWHIFGTLREYVAEIAELASVIGVDHVGVGSDTSVTGPMFPADSLWPDQKAGLGFIPAVAAEMIRQGLPPSAVTKILGGNYAALFGRICG